MKQEVLDFELKRLLKFEFVTLAVEQKLKSAKKQKSISKLKQMFFCSFIYFNKKSLLLKHKQGTIFKSAVLSVYTRGT